MFRPMGLLHGNNTYITFVQEYSLHLYHHKITGPEPKSLPSRSKNSEPLLSPFRFGSRSFSSKDQSRVRAYNPAE